MKGTLDASLPSAVRQLMDDPKEAAEHATIVDLIRNDLSIVADRVSVSRYRYIDKLQTNRGTILQTSSEIQGTLPDNYREIWDTFFSNSCLPVLSPVLPRKRRCRLSVKPRRMREDSIRV